MPVATAPDNPGINLTISIKSIDGESKPFARPVRDHKGGKELAADNFILLEPGKAFSTSFGRWLAPMDTSGPQFEWLAPGQYSLIVTYRNWDIGYKVFPKETPPPFKTI